MTIIKVESALIEGLTRFDIVYTVMEMLDTPLPVTKYEIIKSSNDIVNAINNDTEVANGAVDGAATVAMILGVYEAARAKKQIDFKTQY